MAQGRGHLGWGSVTLIQPTTLGQESSEAWGEHARVKEGIKPPTPRVRGIRGNTMPSCNSYLHILILIDKIQQMPLDFIYKCV